MIKLGYSKVNEASDTEAIKKFHGKDVSKEVVYKKAKEYSSKYHAKVEIYAKDDVYMWMDANAHECNKGNMKSNGFKLVDTISESVNESYDPYQGKKYWVSASISNYPGEISDQGKDTKTNDPKVAIEAYFKLNKKFPMNTDISTQTKKNALELVKYAADHEEWIREMISKYRHHYKPDAFIDAINKKVDDGQKYFHDSEYGDMIYPFDRG